jgi:radical SAM superfamily enzyme YgiQ (UPF0313 family)
MPRQPSATTERLLERERGTVRKDWGGRLPIALVFPNRYYVGMSSLALHVLYQGWNDQPDVVCERVFTDLIPPSSLESRAPLDHFPVLAFSLSYEMDYFSVPSLLRLAGIPVRACQRGDGDPVLLAGGPALSANPEPLAPIVDAVLVGEVEPVLQQLTSTLCLCSPSRRDTLQALGEIPGIYLPNSGAREFPGAPVARQWLRDLDSWPTHSVLLTPDTEFSDMGLIEISRGCGRGCRFCLAGYAYRPPRHRSATNILSQARALLQHTCRIGLVGAAVSDHPEIGPLARELRAMGARISVSSVRTDPISEELVHALAESGTRTLTIAPEAGSERLRRMIHKTQGEDDILHAAELAASAGMEQLKLYFMLGLPSETEQDVAEVVRLATVCSERFRRRVTVNLTPFVPKAHTPFQRLAQTPAGIVKQRIRYVTNSLPRQRIQVRTESPEWSEIQGTLARGDRRLAEALIAATHVTPARWRNILRLAGTPVEYWLRERPGHEDLPWAFIDTAVRTEFLAAESLRADVGNGAVPCLPGTCSAGGVCKDLDRLPKDR